MIQSNSETSLAIGIAAIFASFLGLGSSGYFDGWGVHLTRLLHTIWENRDTVLNVGLPLGWAYAAVDFLWSRCRSGATPQFYLTYRRRAVLIAYIISIYQFDLWDTSMTLPLGILKKTSFTIAAGILAQETSYLVPWTVQLSVAVVRGCTDLMSTNGAVAALVSAAYAFAFIGLSSLADGFSRRKYRYTINCARAIAVLVAQGVVLVLTLDNASQPESAMCWAPMRSCLPSG